MKYRIIGSIFFICIWHIASIIYPPLIVPSPYDTVCGIYDIFLQENALHNAYITICRVLIGLTLIMAIGIPLGILAGTYNCISDLLFVTEKIMTAIPPVIWVVLCVIWFGSDDIFGACITMILVSLPLIYSSSKIAVKTMDYSLFEMAQTFNMTYKKAMLHIGMMHVLTAIYPAMIFIFGQSWRTVIMIELIGYANGIGSAVAISRSNFETQEMFSWLVVIIFLYLLTDYLIIGRVEKYIMKWR